MTRRSVVVLAAVICMRGVTAAGALHGQAPDSAEVRTSATASRYVRPNRAELTLRFSVVDSTPARAGARLAARADSVRGAFAALGIPRDSMFTGSRWYWWSGRVGLIVNPTGRCRTPAQGGCYQWIPDTTYRASETIQLHIADVARVGGVIDAALALNITDLDPIQFSATDTRAAQDEALQEATGQARHRAELIAVASGGRLGRIIGLSTSADYANPYRGSYGLEEVVVRGASALSGPGTQVTAPSITVSASVYGRWRLEPRP